MDLTPFVAAWQAHNWVLFAALAIGLVIATAKQGWMGTWIQAHMPVRALPYYAGALAILGSAATEVIAGVPLQTAAMHAAGAAFLAIFGHNIVIEGMRGGKEIIPERTSNSNPGSSGDSQKKDGPVTPKVVVDPDKTGPTPVSPAAKRLLVTASLMLVAACGPNAVQTAQTTIPADAQLALCIAGVAESDAGKSVSQVMLDELAQCTADIAPIVQILVSREANALAAKKITVDVANTNVAAIYAAAKLPAPKLIVLPVGH